MVHEEINRMLQVLPSFDDVNRVKDEQDLKFEDLRTEIRRLEESHLGLITKKVNKTDFDIAFIRKNEELKALHLAVEVKAEAE